jgi:formylglycine-generating enzyme required for sulfatase activity
MINDNLLKRIAVLLGLCSWSLLGGCGNDPTPKAVIIKAPKEGIAFQVLELSLPMLWCPPGTFLMGSPENEGSRDFDEALREVTLTQGFWLGKHEITQSQWEKIMGDNPSYFKGQGLPVEKMSWDRAKTFCKKLTEQELKAGRLTQDWAYQLPTEAHWEYACRAGAKTAWNFGSSSKEISKHANFSDKNSNLQGAEKDFDDGFVFTAPVGSFPANAWGFHDMHGNVFEWCSDWYEKPEPTPIRDPLGPAVGTEKVFRGGSWALPGIFMRSARRDKNLPILESGFLGFRVSLRKVQTQK